MPTDKTPSIETQSVYVVSGASAGIGRAVTLALAERGLLVVAAARSEKKLLALASSHPQFITPVVADVGTADGIDRIARSTDRSSNVAGIIHCAASLVVPQGYDEIDATELTDHFRIHVASPIALSQAIIRRHPVGRMVFVDSYSANTPRDGWGAYSVVKSAAQMAARCAQQELPKTESIRVNPGAVNTQIVDAILSSKSAAAETFAAMLERGEFAEPSDAAAFIVSLLVDATTDILNQQESWDYNSSDDQTTIANL